jgi:Recombinase
VALVRKIFADYLRLGSIGQLAAALADEGVRPRPRLLANGTTIAASRFMVGPLAHMLKNRFYIGEVVTVARSTEASTNRSSIAPCSRLSRKNSLRGCGLSHPRIFWLNVLANIRTLGVFEK